MTGHLVYREVVVPRLYTVEAQPREKVDQDLWMGVYVGEEFVGFVNSRTVHGSKDGAPGAYLSLRAQVTMSLLERETSLGANGTAWLSDTTGLQDFNFDLSSGEHVMRVDGRVENGMLAANLTTGGETIPFKFPVGSMLGLGGGMAMPALDLPDIEVGHEVFVDTFDPTTMSMSKARIQCLRKEPMTIDDRIIDTKVFLSTVGGMTTRAWVGPAGEVLRAETPFGFSLRKISPEQALAPVAPTEKASLIRTMAVRVSGVTPDRDASRLVVDIRGIPGGQEIPQSDTQRTVLEGMELLQPAAPTEDGPPLEEAARAEALGSDAFITADHEKIRAQAAEIVADAQAPWDKALRIHDWVYQNLEKIAVLSVPSALEVLRTREGDCNEHTILFTALARAAGVPTRVAIGLVWSEELEAFGYHAWPEVYVGRWIPMDPTFGQPLADATHIKLLDGSIDRWAQLLPYLGQLQIEVLASTPANATEPPAS
jgi:hypothetical protein